MPPPQRERKLSTSGDSLYQILGIDRNSTPAQIRRAYRKLALRHHPDKNPGDPTAAERFREICDAYNVLADEQKRDIYDRHGSFGLYIAQQLGARNSSLYFRLASPWCKAFAILCGLLTFCYCCCCCCCCFNFCCGACRPEELDDVASAEDLMTEDGAELRMDEPVLTQPNVLSEP